MASQKDRDRLKKLNEDLRFLLGITPQNGVYVFNNIRYNKRGYDDLIKKTRDDIDRLEKLISPPAQERATAIGRQEELKARAEKLTAKLAKFENETLDFRLAYENAKTVDDQQKLGPYYQAIQRNIQQLNQAIQALRNGSYVAEPTIMSVPSLSEVRKNPIPGTVPGGNAPQPGVVYGGVPGAGQGMAATPPTGTPFTPGAGETVFGGTFVQPGTMATGQTETTTAATTSTTAATTSGTVSTPSGGGAVVTGPAGTTGVSAGPAYTDPATQVTYQPGQQIGGEDRALPNGGAVVDGIYVPPGINYTWLGQQIPEDWKTAAQELYGAYYDMIKNDPQISKLLEDAIKNSWSPEKFQVELEKTNWWRTTTANARQFEILETTDPATARAQLDNRMAVVRETAQRLGVTLNNESLERIARNAITLGFELTAQVEDLVGSEAIRTAGGVSQLRYGYLGNSLRESARKYGVSLSDVTFNEWLNKIAVGSESTETFESYAAQIARTLYPTLSSGFDRGLTFGQMTDPYAQVASRILEIPTTQVDFTDPKWAQAFTMKNDRGEQVPMSFGEWADYLRTNESFGWEYTDDAKNRAFTVVNRLAELFGAA